MSAPTAPVAPAAAPPGLGECFAFPVSTPAARRDLMIGGAVMLLLPIGWVLNMGHRLDVVHRLFHGQPPHPAGAHGFAPWGTTFLRGLRAACAIGIYLSPSIAFAAAAAGADLAALWISAGLCFVLAIFVLPGGMTYNAAFDDISYLYRPDRALRRAVEGGRAYLRAWGIAIAAISLSFLGLLGLGVGFLFTSVWAWMVVGYAFSRALSLARAERP